MNLKIFLRKKSFFFWFKSVVFISAALDRIDYPIRHIAHNRKRIEKLFVESEKFLNGLARPGDKMSSLEVSIISNKKGNGIRTMNTMKKKGREAKRREEKRIVVYENAQ